MKYSRLLSLGAAFFLSFSLCVPGISDAAASKKHAANTHKSVVKKAGQKHSSSKDKKVAAKQIKSKTKKVAANQDDEKAIWQKRAKESDLLTGKASWFGKDFHNKKTASGVLYDMYTFTAAHRTLPMGTVVKVTDQANGKSVMVCVADRGPFVKGRIIDLSYAAAKRLGIHDRGVGKVKLEVVSDEKGSPLKPGVAYFVKYASGNGKKKVGPFSGFADAMAMHEALSQAHPEAEVILDKASNK